MTSKTYTASVLASLRGISPQRPLAPHEALRLAEAQAERLRELLAPGEDAIAESALSALPRLRVLRRSLPTSGLSYWDGQQWLISLNAGEPPTRQRFTLFHEYKHIVDHGRADLLYLGSAQDDVAAHAEQVADYFSGCVLMPRHLVQRAWARGQRSALAISRRFAVSERAAEVRLSQLGLMPPTARCPGPHTRLTGRTAA